MRTSDLSPETFYATDGGMCVRPVTPVASDWVETTNSDGSRLFVLDDCDNPFSCTTSRRGVLVEIFEPSSDLSPSDEPKRRAIVAPRAIKGTWDQYVAVNGEKLRREVATRAERARAERRADELRERLAPALDHLDLTVIVWSRKKLRASGEKASDYEFTIDVRSREKALTYRAAQQAVQRMISRARERG